MTLEKITTPPQVGDVLSDKDGSGRKFIVTAVDLKDRLDRHYVGLVTKDGLSHDYSCSSETLTAIWRGPALRFVGDLPKPAPRPPGQTIEEMERGYAPPRARPRADKKHDAQRLRFPRAVGQYGFLMLPACGCSDDEGRGAVCEKCGGAVLTRKERQQVKVVLAEGIRGHS